MSHFVNWFRKWSRAGRSHCHRPESRVRPRPAIEALEDRLAPTVNRFGDMAQIPYTPHSGPTSLGLNFDGKNFYSQGGFLGLGSQSVEVCQATFILPVQRQSDFPFRQTSVMPLSDN